MKEYKLMDIIGSKDGVLSVGPARMILMSAGAYVFLVRSVHQHAPHALKFLLYDVGYQSGMEFMETLREISADREALLKYAVETVKQAGYGNLSIEEYDFSRPYIRIRGTNLFEASLAEQMNVYRSSRAMDNYSRGMFAGFFSQLLGAEVICEEMSCEARGDESCEFVIMPFLRE